MNISRQNNVSYYLNHCKNRYKQEKLRCEKYLLKQTQKSFLQIIEKEFITRHKDRLLGALQELSDQKSIDSLETMYVFFGKIGYINDLTDAFKN